MTFRPSAPHKKQQWLALLAAMGLLMALMGGAALAASGPSIVDYSQCANGKAGSAGATTDCEPKGWIFGILNPNNSQYREDQVTAQRLIVSFPTGQDHSYDFRYLIRKADAHAYDSLATWDWTQSGADPCQSLTGPTHTACENATAVAPALLAIDPDPLNVNTPCTEGTAATSAHQLAGQQFEMFGLGAGGGIDSMEYGDQSSDAEGTYQSVHLEFHFGSASGGTAYLYFGGHLAASLTPATGSPRGWGEACGSGSIDGGPYHIKLDLIDGASAGNRDNQIMSGAVLPLITPTLATTPTAVATTKVDLSDSLNVGNSSAGGTADFYLYSDNTCTTLVDSDLDVAVSGGLATSKTITVNPVSANTTWYWKVHYDGDPANNLAPADTACGDETASVTIATTSVKTLP